MGPTVAAAVLVPVFRDAERALTLVLVRRREGIVHGGQLAFPGGKCESIDRTPADTALRETREEIGITADAVRIVQQLPVVNTLTTGFTITPFLAHIHPPAVWRCAQEEVAEVLQIPLASLLRKDARDVAIEHLPGRDSPRVIPFYRVGQDRLWGATYRILHPLIPRLAAQQWSF